MKKEKKNNIIMTVIIGVVCIVLFAVMFMQFKTIEETDITAIENMRETELRTEISKWKTQYEEVNQKYEETQETIKEYQEKKQSNEETAELLQQELDQINMILGKTDVQGQGVIITINKVESEDVPAISAIDLQLIVNSLKNAGAEAISINNERIINTTDIVDIADLYIKINAQRILAPYEIKAIGDQTYLESGLLGNGGIVDELRSVGEDIKIEKSNKVVITKYTGEIKSKYMEE